MIMKSIERKIVFALFVIAILFMLFVVINKFTIVDLGYLLFLIGCFIRYIYIRTHP